MGGACLLLPTDLWQQPVTGGPYHRAMRQVEHLQARKRDVHVVSWIRWADSALAKLPAREERDGVRVTRLVMAPPARGLAARAAFFRTLTAEAARAARATGAEGFVVHDPELLLAGLRAARGKPVFYDAHEDFPAMVRLARPLEATLIAALERYAARRVAHVYPVSEGIAARFRAMGAATTTIYNSKTLGQVRHWLAHRDAARTEQGIAPGDFVVGWMGSVTPDQGLELLLEGLRLAPANVRLVAHAGPPAEVERLRGIAAAKGLQGRVTFHEPVPPPELFRRMSGHDAGALLLLGKGPNFEHRAPLKLFDYLALGLPVLTTPVAEPRRIVEDAGCGMVVEPRAEAVGEALTRLAAAKGLADKLGEAAQRAFRETYCGERMEARLEASHGFWR